MLLLLLTGLYNHRTFGNFFRNGYHYWCPVPYDFPSLTWSAGYFSRNAQTLLKTPILPLAALAAALLAMRRSNALYVQGRRELDRILVFAAFGVAPAVITHLFYFYQDTRFFLPASCVMAVLCGSLLGRLFSDSRHQLLWIPFLILAASEAGWRALGSPPPARRIAADTIRARTPGDAVVVSTLDPAYLELMAGERSGRRIVALSRDTEYASKLIAPWRISGLRQQPTDWHDHRNEALLPAGAIEAVERVAAEHPEMLRNFLAEGRRIFLVAVAPTATDVEGIARLTQQYELVSLAKDFYEILPLKEESGAGGRGRSRAHEAEVHSREALPELPDVLRRIGVVARLPVAAVGAGALL
jgi:hypothetical protein